MSALLAVRERVSNREAVGVEGENEHDSHSLRLCENREDDGLLQAIVD